MTQADFVQNEEKSRNNYRCGNAVRTTSGTKLVYKVPRTGELVTYAHSCYRTLRPDLHGHIVISAAAKFTQYDSSVTCKTATILPSSMPILPIHFLTIT